MEERKVRIEHGMRIYRQLRMWCGVCFERRVRMNQENLPIQIMCTQDKSI